MVPHLGLEIKNKFTLLFSREEEATSVKINLKKKQLTQILPWKNQNYSDKKLTPCSDENQI
jgi:hypothetical protein